MAFISGFEVVGRSACFIAIRSIMAGVSGAAAACASAIVRSASGAASAPAMKAPATAKLRVVVV